MKAKTIMTKVNSVNRAGLITCRDRLLRIGQWNTAAQRIERYREKTVLPRYKECIIYMCTFGRFGGCVKPYRPIGRTGWRTIGKSTLRYWLGTFGTVKT